MIPDTGASHKLIPNKGPTFLLDDRLAGLPFGSFVFKCDRNRAHIEAAFIGPLKMIEITRETDKMTKHQGGDILC